YGIGLTVQPTAGMQEKWGGGIWANYIAFFSDPFVFDSVWITLRLALPAALFNVLAAIPVAFKLRGKFRGKRLLTTLLVLPITLGTSAPCLGRLTLAVRECWLNTFLLRFGVLSEPSQFVSKFLRVFLSLVISGCPFSFLLISSYLSRIDPSL